MKKQEVIISILWLLVGLALTICGILEALDSFWSGMGSALLVIGAVRLLRGYRLSKSDTYREKRAVAETDERYHFIRNKAWAWAGFLFVMIGAVGSIVFKLLGQNLLCQVCGFAVCLMVALYWICFFILKKKY